MDISGIACTVTSFSLGSHVHLLYTVYTPNHLRNVLSSQGAIPLSTAGLTTILSSFAFINLSHIFLPIPTFLQTLFHIFYSYASLLLWIVSPKHLKPFTFFTPFNLTIPPRSLSFSHVLSYTDKNLHSSLFQGSSSYL